MASTEAPKFGVKFPSRKERTVKRVTKCETREIQKRIVYFFFSDYINFFFIIQGLEPPKPAPVRPPPKPKAPKKHHHQLHFVNHQDLLVINISLFERHTPSVLQNTNTYIINNIIRISTSRTLQTSDLEKLARLNCSREFSLFNQYIKPELSKAYENQLAFLQTKLQHLKNEFVNKQAEHLNFEQIKEYYEQAVKENIRRHIKPDEYLTLAEKFKQDAKQVK